MSSAVNYILVKSIGTSYQRMPFLRIAPICNGKIYVLPRNTHSEEPGKLDIPMEDYIYACKTDTDKYAKEIEKKYSRYIDGIILWMIFGSRKQSYYTFFHWIMKIKFILREVSSSAPKR